jgi:WD40 repeat protein
VPDANDVVVVPGVEYRDSYSSDGPNELGGLVVERLDAQSGKAVKQLAKTSGGTIYSRAALSPDGKLLALAVRAYKNPRKHVQLVEVASGRLVGEIREEGVGWFLSVAFSRDGRSLALGGCDEILLVDVATAKVTDRLKTPMGTVAFLAFRPDGMTLASHSHDNQVRLWDLALQKETIRFGAKAAGREVIAIPWGLQPGPKHETVAGTEQTALSPDGTTIAVGISSGLQCWDTRTGNKLFPELLAADGWAGAFAFSPDDRLLLVGGPDRARLWDPITGTVRRVLPFPLDAAAFSPDGRQLAVAPRQGENGRGADTASILELATGKELQRLGHPASGKAFRFHQLAFAPDGNTLLTLTGHQATRGYEDTVVVHRWSARTGEALGCVQRADSYPWCSVIAPDARTAVISLPRGLLVVDLETDQDICIITGEGLEGRLRWRGFSPDSQLLFVESGYWLSVWELATGSLVSRRRIGPPDDGPPKEGPDALGRESPLHRSRQAEIEALLVSPDGRLVASSERNLDGSRGAYTAPAAIRIWDWMTGKQVQRLEGFRSRSTSLAFTYDGRCLASWFHNGTALIWDSERSSHADENRGERLSTEKLNALWDKLGLADAAMAYQAITTLGASPEQTVSFLGRRLRPASADEARHARDLVRALNSDAYEDREAAGNELRRLTGQYESVLRGSLKGQLRPEVRRRLEVLLAPRRPPPPETLRMLRALRILEGLASTEARQLLARLAAGVPEARVTQEARAALTRLARRQANPP